MQALQEEIIQKNTNFYIAIKEPAIDCLPLTSTLEAIFRLFSKK
jgi:hypothetical protein